MDERKSGAGGGVVPAARVKVSSEGVRIGPPRSADAGTEPKVQLVHEGDVVRAIQITCTCGEQIIIRCDYT